MRCHVFECLGQRFIYDDENRKIIKILWDGEKADNEIVDEYVRKRDVPKKNIVDGVKFDICNRLIINVTDSCNMRCKYCYANEGDYNCNHHGRIKRETIDNIVNKIYSIFPEGVKVVQFFGGEPLLEKTNMSYFHDKLCKKCRQLGINEPEFVMVTNGTLIYDSDNIDFIKENLDSVTISLDGTQEVHDYNRIMKDGSGSYERVINNILKLKEEAKNMRIGTETTITKKHLEQNDIKSLEEIIGLDLDFCAYSPAFDVDGRRTSMADNSESEISEYMRKWFERDFELRPRVLKNIKRLLKSNSENLCGAACEDIAIDVLGNIYPCFMFIGKNEYKIGNINTDNIHILKFNLANIKNDIQDKVCNIEDCEDCWMKNLCSISYGHCIGARLMQSGDIKKVNKLFCDISKISAEEALKCIVKDACIPK